MCAHWSRPPKSYECKRISLKSTLHEHIVLRLLLVCCSDGYRSWLAGEQQQLHLYLSYLVSRYCTYCQYQRSGATKGARDVVIRIGGQEFLAFSRRRFLSGVEWPQLGYSLIPAQTGVLRGSHHHRFIYIYVYICGGSDWGLNVSSLSS